MSLIAIHAHQIPHVFDPEVIAEAAAGETRDDGPSRGLARDPARDHRPGGCQGPRRRGPRRARPRSGNPGALFLRVAIADVAAYARPGAALDREAQERGNSVYFPDRVVPMLPERISNDLCFAAPKTRIARRLPPASSSASMAIS